MADKKIESIESKVPGEQQLRGAATNSATETALNVNENKDDFVLTPVLHITKEETTWTKDGVKLQKVVVCGDTTDEITTVNKTVSVMESTDPDTARTEIHSEVHVSTRIEGVDEKYKDNHEDTKADDDEHKDSKESNKILMLRLKQRIDKIKKEVQQSTEKMVFKPYRERKVQSAIPRLKDIKHSQNIQTDVNKNEEDQKNQQQQQESPKLDDEFDKIYEEIIEKDAFNNSIPTPDKIDELSKVDTKFEEIIHSYEDNTVQRTVTEKVKSKIPLLKRKSEQEIEIPPNINRKSSLKKSLPIEDSISKIAVAKIKDKTINTDLERTVITKNDASSESHSTETKSESFSAAKFETSESISTSATKIITTQISTTTEEQVNVSSKENVKIEQNNNTDITKDITSITSKDNLKCKIPVSLNTKKKLEAKLSNENNSEKVSEQITTGTVRTFIVDRSEKNYKEDTHSTKKDETKSENKVNITQQVNPKIWTSSNENKSVNELNPSQTIQSKIYGSLQEDKSIEQSLYTSESVAVKRTLTDNTKVKVTEISKVNTEVQNHFTNEVKETIQVATLKYDASLGSESKTIIDNGNITVLEKYVTGGSTTVTSDITNKEATTNHTNASITETKIITNENLEVQKQLNSSVSIKKVSDNTLSEYESKTEEQNNVKEKDITNIKTEYEKVKTIKDDFNEVKIESNNQLERNISAVNLATVKSAVSADDDIKGTIVQETNVKAIQVQALQNEKVDVVINKENANSNNIKQSLTTKEEQHDTNMFEDKISNNQIVYESNKISIETNLINNDVEIKTNEDYSKSVTNNLSSQIKDMEDLEEEDIIILKGKVSRIISRLDSREQNINKTDIDDLPNVSVTAKIADFEKSDLTNTIQENKYNSDTKVNTGVKDKPKIVDELLKAPDNDLDVNHNEQNTVTKNETNNTKYNNNISNDVTTKFNKDNSSDDPYDNNSKFQSDYYTMYNKVHSSIVNRLNSIEIKLKTTEVVKETETQNEIVNTSNSLVKDNKVESISNLKGTTSVSEPNISSNKVQNTIEENEVFVSKKEQYPKVDMFKEYRAKKDPDSDRRAKSVAELDIGDAVKGRVRQMVYRMNSMERMRMLMRSETVDRKERLRKISITDRVALFEKKIVPICTEETTHRTTTKSTTAAVQTLSEEELQEKIAELSNAKNKYGKWKNVSSIELRDGSTMPALAVGTALLEPRLVKHIISAAIDLGYRAIDTAFIYGNEKQIGEAIKAKIDDGTVTRGELFIISKLWSTFHRRDLVTKACKQSLDVMGLDYFDLYLIHNPMSFKEGNNPLPKIANVLQYSEHDYLEAWYGIEDLIRNGLVKRGGISNFNSMQVERVVDKGKIKPVINQVECHPYLTQQRLDDFCLTRNVKLSCFGVLGSKGTPLELKSGLPPVIDDPLVKVMSAGLGVTPAQLLIAYQLQAGRNVVVKSSSAYHLWDNLQALSIKLDQAQVSALNALNRNKRTFTFTGMGDTHRNYPFKIPY